MAIIDSGGFGMALASPGRAIVDDGGTPLIKAARVIAVNAPIRVTSEHLADPFLRRLPQ
jgi:hypothetical protein